jgi:hypothetical protein
VVPLHPGVAPREAGAAAHWSHYDLKHCAAALHGCKVFCAFLGELVTFRARKRSVLHFGNAAFTAIATSAADF